MAASILAHLSKNKPYPLEVQSAGIYAIPGEEMNPQAKEVLLSSGINFLHRAQRLDNSLLEWANIVFTMTEQHKQFILVESPSIQEKVYTLTEYIADRSVDIMDPYGTSVEIYRRCANELNQHLENLIEKWSKE
jgi:protein-tyrosine-phosphatase